MTDFLNYLTTDITVFGFTVQYWMFFVGGIFIAWLLYRVMVNPSD